MTFVRSAIFNVCFFAFTIVLLVAGLPTLARNRHAVLRLARMWSRGSRWLLAKICGATVEYRGLEHIPSRPALIAAKHQSTLETFAIIENIDDFSFILKRELMFIPLFGWYLKRAQQIAIDRSSGRAAVEQAVERSRALLAEGRSIFIFPEGTRTTPGAPPRYKMGVAHIYEATGAVCLPVALNTGVFWPRRSFLKHPGRVVIEFLPVIDAGLPKADFLATLQDRVESATNALIAEAVAADPSAAARLSQSSA